MDSYFLKKHNLNIKDGDTNYNIEYKETGKLNNKFDILKDESWSTITCILGW